MGGHEENNEAYLKGIAPQTDYLAVPGDWFSAVSGNGTAFAISLGATANSPDIEDERTFGSPVRVWREGRV